MPTDTADRFRIVQEHLGESGRLWFIAKDGTIYAEDRENPGFGGASITLQLEDSVYEFYGWCANPVDFWIDCHIARCQKCKVWEETNVPILSMQDADTYLCSWCRDEN